MLHLIVSASVVLSCLVEGRPQIPHGHSHHNVGGPLQQGVEYTVPAGSQLPPEILNNPALHKFFSENPEILQSGVKIQIAPSGTHPHQKPLAFNTSFSIPTIEETHQKQQQQTEEEAPKFNHYVEIPQDSFVKPFTSRPIPKTTPAPLPVSVSSFNQFLSNIEPAVRAPSAPILQPQNVPVQQTQRVHPPLDSVHQRNENIQVKIPKVRDPSFNPFVAEPILVHGEERHAPKPQQFQRIVQPTIAILDNRPKVSRVQIERAEPLRTTSPLREEVEKKQHLDDEFKKQAQNAQYQFASNVDDKINGNQLYREEKRDGANVEGQYSYSDGFVKRTVYYVADDKGYRVVRQEVENLDGPVQNPNGEVHVSNVQNGNKISYVVTQDDIIKPKTQQPLRKI